MGLNEKDGMFSAYLSEKEGKHTYFTDDGFFVWKFLPHSNEFWVCFIYIKPEKRCGSAFKHMMEEIKFLADYAKAKQIIADINIENAGSEYVLQLFFKRGMKIGEIRDNKTIWLYYPLLQNTIINNDNTGVSNG